MVNMNINKGSQETEDDVCVVDRTYEGGNAIISTGSSPSREVQHILFSTEVADEQDSNILSKNQERLETCFQLIITYYHHYLELFKFFLSSSLCSCLWYFTSYKFIVISILQRAARYRLARNSNSWTWKSMSEFNGCDENVNNIVSTLLFVIFI